MRNNMKKLKSAGFAALYLAIPIVMQFLIAVVLGMQMLALNFVSGGTGQVDFNQIQERFQSSQYNLILVALLNFIFIVGFGLWYYFIRTRRDVSPVDYRMVVSRKSILCTLGLAVASQFVCNIIMTLFAILFPDVYRGYIDLAQSFDINVLPPWAMLFIVTVWSPLAEELIFRAMIFRTLRKGFSFLPAAVISGVLFGVYHMNWVQGVYAAALGVLLAFTYEKTNSLLGCYLFHLMFNLLSYVIEGIQSSGILPDIVLGIVLLALEVGSLVGIGFFIRRFSKLYPKRPDVPVEVGEEVQLVEKDGE